MGLIVCLTRLERSRNLKLVHLVCFSCLIALSLSSLAAPAQADPIPVRHQRGSVRGFLELRAGDGQVVASGDFVQTAHGERITSETVFHFRDGSVDDETTVYTQHRVLQLLTDHRIQKGPSFPHPMDVLIDAPSGQVTVRSVGKDGKPEVKTDHLNLPPDLANGIVSAIAENMRFTDPPRTAFLVLATPKPLLAKLVLTPLVEETAPVAGLPRKATHYEIKVDLGGFVGVLAPLLGKKPPTIQIWTVGGGVSTFAREEGPIYPEGPIMTIQLASPTWPR